MVVISPPATERDMSPLVCDLARWSRDPRDPHVLQAIATEIEQLVDLPPAALDDGVKYQA